LQTVPRNRLLADQTFFISATLKHCRALFAEQSAARVVFDSWQFFRRRGEIRLYGYVIMPDHVHILLQVIAPLTVSSFMRRFKDFVAHAMAQGPIWDKGYWSEIITDESMLIEKLTYIHSNPVRKNLAAEIQDYRWSSAIDYYHDAEPQFVDPWQAIQGDQ
jgi:putative transposase